MQFGWLICAIVMMTAVSAEAADEKLLRELYVQIPSQYIMPVKVETVAIRLLKGMSAVDKKLRVADDNDKVSLYYQGKLVKSIYKPEARYNLEAWITLSAEIMDLAATKSPIANQRDFEMVDLMLAATVHEYDADSKFYANTEQSRKEKRKYRDQFAARTMGEVLYVKLGAFNPASRGSLADSLHEFADRKGLILDLRGNPGGMLSEAVDIADLFMEEGIVVEVKSRSDTVYYNAKPEDVWNGKPLVVLVDGNTASSAEVLAAALQEQGRAKIVGTLTYGKGTIQNIMPLSDGATLSLTHALLYTPSGNMLNNRGVLPDVCTFEMPEAKNIDNLLKLKEKRFCPAEKREDRSLDAAVAEAIIME